MSGAREAASETSSGEAHSGEAPAPAPPTERLPTLDLDIVIGDDGEVIFTDLPAELIEVALALDPDSELACRRPDDTES